MAEKKPKKDLRKREPHLTFLRRVKEGEYAEIEKSSLPYARMEAQTIIVEDEYYYGLR